MTTLKPKAEKQREGMQRKQAGQQLSLLSAGPTWVDQAIVALFMYISSHSDHTFTFPGFRAWAIEGGHLTEPRQLNAWGALARTAQKAGLCSPTNQLAIASHPSAHGRMVRIWRAL